MLKRDHWRRNTENFPSQAEDDAVIFPTLTMRDVLGLSAYTRLRYERWKVANQDGKSGPANQD